MPHLSMFLHINVLGLFFSGPLNDGHTRNMSTSFSAYANQKWLKSVFITLILLIKKWFLQKQFWPGIVSFVFAKTFSYFLFGLDIFIQIFGGKTIFFSSELFTSTVGDIENPRWPGGSTYLYSWRHWEPQNPDSLGCSSQYYQGCLYGQQTRIMVEWSGTKQYPSQWCHPHMSYRWIYNK